MKRKDLEPGVRFRYYNDNTATTWVAGTGKDRHVNCPTPPCPGILVDEDAEVCPDANDLGPADGKISKAYLKAPLGLVPIKALTGAARVFQYGAKKYALGNFLQATLADGAGERYHSGVMRHASACQNLNGTWDLTSLAALDDESGLPHIDHMICGLIMLRTILIKEGALAEDPGMGKEPPK